MLASSTEMSQPTRLTAEDPWTDRLFSKVLLATLVALCYLLFSEIITFSGSLDDLSLTDKGDWFIWLSRICASFVILVLAKEVVISIIAGLSTTRPARSEPRSAEGRATPLVSVIVPAYNEGDVIADTLASISTLDYPNLEIILVDDGSTDDTLSKARLIAAGHARVRIDIVSQPNSGKWKALNTGFAKARGEFIMCIDADGIVLPDALHHMLPHFDDPAVAAVSGQVQVRNQSNILTRLQALEYLVANGSSRTAQAITGCVLIVPGPLGLFRRSVLEEVTRKFSASGDGDGISEASGPFTSHTFAEDFEVSVMICSLGHKIVYEPRAVSSTAAPTTMNALLNQRYRWLRGSMQVAARYHDEGWGRKAGNRALRWWMMLATTVELYVIPVGCLLLLATLAWTMVAGDPSSILTLWMLVWAIHVCTAAIFIRSHGEKLSLALLAPVQSLYGAFLLVGAWTHAALDQAVSRPMRW